MNCENCGAPMSPVDGRNYLTCGYCQTFRFPTEIENSADRITPLAERADVACPVCSAELEVGAFDNVRMMFCRRCRGALIANESFAQVVGTRRREYSGAEQIAVPIDTRQYERRLDCSGCGGRMEVHPYHGPGNVVIDSCATCHLLWLDHGELAAIERAPGRRTPISPSYPTPTRVATGPALDEQPLNLLDFLFS